ncbi:PLD nuclease N-terminal domain-containing protein [Glaciihabitans arcticus]|nr:PLD nuclease N-terminal domain-containing protein [Glaciihabitans arcticus]
MLRILFPFLVIAFDIFCIVDVILSKSWQIKTLNKVFWIIIILLLPVIGGILWFIFGKDRGQDSAQGSAPRRTVAPDDDPAYLSKLAREQEQQDRIRDLEAQLGDLDDPDEKPGDDRSTRG